MYNVRCVKIERKRTMLKKFAVLACVLALFSCSTFHKLTEEDRTVTEAEKIPLNVGILNLVSTHLDTNGIFIANEDKAIVLVQAHELLGYIFDRVSENTRLPDNDILVHFDYTTKVKKNTATCYGVVAFIRAKTREPILELKCKAVNEGRITDRQGVVRYNAILKTQRKLAKKIRGNGKLRKLAKSLGRSVAPLPVAPVESKPESK